MCAADTGGRPRATSSPLAASFLTVPPWSADKGRNPARSSTHNKHVRTSPPADDARHTPSRPRVPNDIPARVQPPRDEGDTNDTCQELPPLPPPFRATTETPWRTRAPRARSCPRHPAVWTLPLPTALRARANPPEPARHSTRAVQTVPSSFTRPPFFLLFLLAARLRAKTQRARRHNAREDTTRAFS